ncbi:MAG: hypothetical protein CMI54_01675 [Parcubacteria group bacterium]|nr:hypothetical protein [Parcubacteria group bacterium]
MGQSRKLHREKKKALKVLNAMSTQKDGLWQPKKEDIPRLKRKKGHNEKNKARKSALTKLSKEFYYSDEWRRLRVRVLEKYKCKCMMCGRSPKKHGVVIHVDHIKPRSKNPELSLDFDNLQLLCEDCNLGKSNKYQTDWRPETV